MSFLLCNCYNPIITGKGINKGIREEDNVL